ncbi:MAG TPA: DUF951 domain-containing protein [Candidatus Limnocylindrales bacterium]|nr:DUF951 domain-containing protein [Candidatus Limnocylindrales bacterium]
MAPRPSDRQSGPPLELAIGDVLRLRRRHPCGDDTWSVVRLGADIGLRCRGCGRRILLERRSIERRFGGFVEQAARPKADE